MGGDTQAPAIFEPQMIEVVSLGSLISRPMYFDGGYHSTRMWWQRPEDIALKALCEDRVPLVTSAGALGRSPTSIAHRARDAGFRLPGEWKDAITKSQPKAVHRPLMQYPYIAKVRGEHADLLAVNALVPHGLPQHLRGDVCQEIMLALWEGQISIEELRSNKSLVSDFIGRARKANYEAGGYALSLDAPMGDGRSWYEVLPTPVTEGGGT